MLLGILYTDKRIYEDIKSTNPVTVNLALGQLYSKLYNGTLVFISKNSGTKEQAEDVLADALLIFYENIKKNKFDFRESIKPYIFKIINNIWCEELKKINKSKKIVTKTDSNLNLDDIVLLEQEIGLRKNTEELIADLFDKVGSKCKDILTLYYYCNYSMKEISEELNYSDADSAKVQKNKCMQRLKTYINSSIDIKEELLINKNIIENR